MNNKTDAEIVKGIVEGLGLTSLQKFAKELGYSNSSSIYHLMKNLNGRKINESFIDKVLERYPQVNELYIRKKSDVVLINAPMKISTTNLNQNFTLNDMPVLLIDLIEEQKKTNGLLSDILKKD
tara:strand:- start:1187 stop:1558 length:372 start_codon:yes stop_codon:yes gene_type:complete